MIHLVQYNVASYVATLCSILLQIYLSVKGSIEVQIATMSKQDRSKTNEVYVCGFVPSYALPNKMPWSLDPFLHPLVTEIEDTFVNGIVCVCTVFHILGYSYRLGYGGI